MRGEYGTFVFQRQKRILKVCTITFPARTSSYALSWAWQNFFSKQKFRSNGPFPWHPYWGWNHLGSCFQARGACRSASAQCVTIYSSSLGKLALKNISAHTWRFPLHGFTALVNLVAAIRRRGGAPHASLVQFDLSPSTSELINTIMHPPVRHFLYNVLNLPDITPRRMARRWGWGAVTLRNVTPQAAVEGSSTNCLHLYYRLYILQLYIYFYILRYSGKRQPSSWNISTCTSWICYANRKEGSQIFS